jgi:hypothetical protein
MKRNFLGLFVVLSLFVVTAMMCLGAAPSEVADAVMRGDKAAMQKLIGQHADGVPVR